MATVLDWAEKAGIENMRDHANNAEFIQKQASTLLTMLLSGAAAALYFGFDHLDLRFAAVTVSFWLFGLSAYLTRQCLMFGDFPAVWNEPNNLNQKGFELDQLRAFELKNLQERINIAIKLNFTKSLRLNRCILSACCTPIIGVIAWMVQAYGFSA